MSKAKEEEEEEADFQFFFLSFQVVEDAKIFQAAQKGWEKEMQVRKKKQMTWENEFLQMLTNK